MDEADEALRAQYEAYPYPARNPRDEGKRLAVGSPSHIREIDFWVFGAARSASRPLRALFAGGGTGDGAIMLATQLVALGRPGHVTWLDRSRAARAIAEGRAAARKLENITFVEGSLLDLPSSGLGPFDYVDCCGVLHHLPDPAAGLAALTSVLAEDGGIGLMVYAPHGRTGVYMVQDALRLLAPAEALPPSERVAVARRILKHLPKTNWLRFNPNFTDLTLGGDAGVYDLLLNPRDRAFDVRAFFSLVEGEGLEVATLIEPARYDPALLLPDPKLRAAIEALAPLDRAALAEALAANMPTHIAYCVRAGARVATPDPMAQDAVPVARETPGSVFAEQLGPGNVLPMQFDALTVGFPMPPFGAAILRRIDGVRTVGDMAAELGEAFWRDWPAVWRVMSGINRVLLRAPR